jgi:glutathione S-transferase
MVSVHHRNNQSGAIVESLADRYGGAGRLIPPAGTGAATESRQFLEPQPRCCSAYQRALERGGPYGFQP